MGYSILRRITAVNSLRRCIFSGGGRAVSTVSPVSNESPIRNRIPVSPCLMLPSDKEVKFFELHSLGKGSQAAEEEEALKFRSIVGGSSHGFVDVCEEKGCQLNPRPPIEGKAFLYNKHTGRRVNLPPVPHGFGSAEKVIMTGEEGEEDCRAVMRLTNDCRDCTLAYCCPGRSKDWIFIGEEDWYEDFVYSPTYKLWFCTARDKVTWLEAWDLVDPLSPRLDWSETCSTLRQEGGQSWDYKLPSEYVCVSGQYLVASQEKKEIFIVLRYMNEVADASAGIMPRTSGFRALKIVRGDGESGGWMREMRGDLEGQVMFVGGVTHGVAVAGESVGFPPPNSICFSEDKYSEDLNYGVFDYETKSFRVNPRTLPPPIWITPTCDISTFFLCDSARTIARTNHAKIRNEESQIGEHIRGFNLFMYKKF